MERPDPLPPGLPHDFDFEPFKAPMSHPLRRRAERRQVQAVVESEVDDAGRILSQKMKEPGSIFQSFSDIVIANPQFWPFLREHYVPLREVTADPCSPTPIGVLGNGTIATKPQTFYHWHVRRVRFWPLYALAWRISRWMGKL